jgi:hydrogenase maturation protein HypF
MTSANRSSEPIAIDDDEALDRLSGIADAFLIGERPIARRLDDSIARASAFGPTVLRRARGYAPGAVTALPTNQPILAVGADLKNTITLVVEGQAFVSQHIGDLEHFQSFQAFQQTIEDLVSMYGVDWEQLLIVRDSHPQYASSLHADSLPSRDTHRIQHHRAHIASVLAERGEWHQRVVGISFDGTGYGDDGTIWGGEFFVGSVSDGFDRVGHLRRAILAGGDAAARHPVQAAVGFLVQLAETPDVTSAPFNFPDRYQVAMDLVRKGVRAFTTSSVGRLFDAAAALLGFTRETTFEGQAAMWLEQVAACVQKVEPYPFPFQDGELDFRPLLINLVQDRSRSRDPRECARAFQTGIAHGLFDAATALCRENDVDTIVLSGGVFQNDLLLKDLKVLVDSSPFRVWTNRSVPANDGGISLGQAALASFGQFDMTHSANAKEAATFQHHA